MNRDDVEPNRIDLHCHLVPGVDDGCQTVEQSLECVRRWREAGYCGSVCTPHMAIHAFPENTPSQIAARVRELQTHVDEAGLDYQLWASGEVRLGEGVVEWLQEWGVPTLGEGRWVLVDYFGRHWPSCCDEGIDFLVEQGYKVLVAHPERLGMPEAEWSRAMDRLAGRGVHVQGNLNSVAGGEGPIARDRALRWLDEDRYFVLASDTHGPDSVPGRQLGLSIALYRVGLERATKLLSSRPAAMVEGRI